MQGRKYPPAPDDPTSHRTWSAAHGVFLDTAEPSGARLPREETRQLVLQGCVRRRQVMVQGWPGAIACEPQVAESSSDDRLNRRALKRAVALGAFAL